MPLPFTPKGEEPQRNVSLYLDISNSHKAGSESVRKYWKKPVKKLSCLSKGGNLTKWFGELSK